MDDNSSSDYSNKDTNNYNGNNIDNKKSRNNNNYDVSVERRGYDRSCNDADYNVSVVNVNKFRRFISGNGKGNVES